MTAIPLSKQYCLIGTGCKIRLRPLRTSGGVTTRMSSGAMLRPLLSTTPCLATSCIFLRVGSDTSSVPKNNTLSLSVGFGLEEPPDMCRAVSGRHVRENGEPSTPFRKRRGQTPNMQIYLCYRTDSFKKERRTREKNTNDSNV